MKAPVSAWLEVENTGEPEIYALRFDDKFIGNPVIRSVHGGVTGALMEVAAQAETESNTGNYGQSWVLSNSIDYLRITRDEDMFARARIQRLSRRLCVVDVTCWQDTEENPVARGIVTLKVESALQGQ